MGGEPHPAGTQGCYPALRPVVQNGWVAISMEGLRGGGPVIMQNAIHCNDRLCCPYTHAPCLQLQRKTTAQQQPQAVGSSYGSAQTTGRVPNFHAF